MKKIIKGFGYLLGFILLLFFLLILLATMMDYKPDEVITVYESDSPDTLGSEGKYSLLSWNIGYAGLGSDMDFFYDGGTHVRTSRQRTLTNLNAIGRTLENNDTVDFILLQEVDFNSKRTYRINEWEELSNYLPEFQRFKAINYKVIFVPVPPSSPMGKVNSGLVMFTKYQPERVERRDFPGQYSWPTRLFMLDRCFLVSYFPFRDGNKLLVIDTHNSAFDDGTLKQQEMAYLKEFLLDQAKQGNHVIVGGDWNQNPPGYVDSLFNTNSGYENFALNNIPEDFLPSSWTWAFDPSLTTNRSLVKPYQPGVTASTILDFFLLSPGIEREDVSIIDLNFENSDHQPVLLTVGISDAEDHEVKPD